MTNRLRMTLKYTYFYMICQILETCTYGIQLLLYHMFQTRKRQDYVSGLPQQASPNHYILRLDFGLAKIR